MIYSDFRNIIRDRTEISVRYDVETASVWCYLKPKVRPCFSYKMLCEIHALQQELISYFQKYDMNPPVPVKFFVWASQANGIFNYGGDLNMFADVIERQDKETLTDYGTLATEIVYLNSINLNLPLTTLSVVEGNALGGGFEAAFSCNIMIVEEQAKIGLPEIRFNLFPGMGAYSLLVRSLGVKKAEEIITSGKVYTAKEFYDMGLLTLLAPKGEGISQALKYMQWYSEHGNGMQAVTHAREIYLHLKREEFMDINKLWVEAAMRLKKKDLKVMRKLVTAQNMKQDNIFKLKRTRQDRRIKLQGEIYKKSYADRRIKLDRRAS